MKPLAPRQMSRKVTPKTTPKRTLKIKTVINPCPKCNKKKDAFEFVRLNWKTNSGKDRTGMVCTDCYDREIKRRETPIK